MSQLLLSPPASHACAQHVCQQSVPCQLAPRRAPTYACGRRRIACQVAQPPVAIPITSIPTITIPTMPKTHTTTSTTSTTTTTDAEDAAPTSSTAAADTALLFDAKHLPKFSLGLLLYMPFGLLIAVARSLLWIACIGLDAKWFRQPWVVSTYSKLLGVSVEWRHKERLPATKHVTVSNHVTVGDLMFLFTALQRYHVFITSALPARVMASANLPIMLRPATPGMFEQLAAADPAKDPAPIHVFPEGGMTNGKGLLSFSRGFMRIVQLAQLPVVPIALRAKVPFGINTHTLTSSFLANLFWFSFAPTIKFEATVLPPMTPGEGEGRGHFVKRVQEAIAGELGVPVTDLTIKQKRQHMQAAARKASQKAK